MSATYYTISDARIAEIIAADQDLEADIVRDFCTADWNEGEEHQHWLDTAPANEIASWLHSLNAESAE